MSDTDSQPAGDAGPVFVELEGSGFREVGAVSPEELAKASGEALDRAMQTIRHMGERVSGSVATMRVRPRQVEVAFGIKLDAEVGAIVAKSRGAASLDVRIVWDPAARTDE